MSKVSIKPLADRVLVEPAAAETKTSSGIIIPDEVFVSASEGSTRTLSANGLIFILLIIVPILFNIIENDNYSHINTLNKRKNNRK